MKWTVGIKIGFGYLVALFILASIGAISYHSITVLLETSKWAGHTHEVISELEEELKLVHEIIS